MKTVKMAVIEQPDGILKFIEAAKLQKATYSDCIECGFSFHDLGLISIKNDENMEFVFKSQVGHFQGIKTENQVMNMKIDKRYCVKYFDGVTYFTEMITNIKFVTAQIISIESDEKDFSWYEIKIGINIFITSKGEIDGNKSPFYKVDDKGPDF